MLAALRLLLRALELVLALPLRLLRLVLLVATARPNLGPFRHVVSAAVLYLLFALLLVCAVRRCRGWVRPSISFFTNKLRYDAERWLATAVYDAGGGFVGTFDPRLDSQRDINCRDRDQDRQLHRQPEHKWICGRRGADALLGVARRPRDRRIGGLLGPPASTSSASSRSAPAVRRVR